MKKIYFLFALLLSVITANAADITGGTKLYLNGGGSSLWNQADAWFSAYLWDSNGNNTWVTGTSTDDSNVYEFVAPDGTWTNVLFVRVAPSFSTPDWSNGSIWNKTNDLTYDGTNNLCTITGWDGANYTWSVYGTTVEPVEPTTLTYNVTVPEGTPACYIAGDMNGWNLTAMTKVDDTHYTITIEGATTSNGYKYSCSNSWDDVEVDGNGNDISNRTYSENDVVAKWKASSYPEALYIVGFDGSWEPANPTEISGADGIYTAKNLVFTNGTFKLSKAKGDWDTFNGGCLYMGAITVGEEAAITSGDGDNSIATGTYDVTINLITKTFKATVPTTTGVEETLVDTDAAVEYFNLQGVKVANPENGIFIKKQGSKAVKVAL